MEWLEKKMSHLVRIASQIQGSRPVEDHQFDVEAHFLQLLLQDDGRFVHVL